MATDYILLLGKEGNISQSFQKILASDSRFKYSVLSYSELRKLVEERGFREYLFNITELHPRLNIWVVYCCGVTSSHVSFQTLRTANIDFPTHILHAILGTKVRLVTFGTIMENFIAFSESNPYLHSKLIFSQGLSLVDTSAYLHIRLHTLYGGVNLQPHMFLGQLFNSLKSREDFVMSKGEQKREYHHIDDDLAVCLQLILSQRSGTFEINSGKPIKLIDLANSVYEYFLPTGRVLPILESSPFDIFEMNFEPISSIHTDSVIFRDPIDGVIDYFLDIDIY